MYGPAKSRLRIHLELARDYINLYKDDKKPADLESAEFHLHTASEIYEVIYVKV